MSNITVMLSQPKYKKMKSRFLSDKRTHTALNQSHPVRNTDTTNRLMWNEINYHREVFGDILQKKLFEIMLEHINTNRKARFWFWTQNQLRCVWITCASFQIKTVMHCKQKFLLRKKSSLLTSGEAKQNKCNVKMAHQRSILICTQETDLLIQEKSRTKVVSRKLFSIVKLCHFRKTGKISSE